MSDDLKPCPFCPTGARRVIHPASGTPPYVLCDCGAAGAQKPTEAEAVQAWNRRSPTVPSPASPVSPSGGDVVEALEALRDIKRWNATYKSGVGVVYVESLNGGLVRYRDLLDRSATLHSAGSDAAQGVAVRALEWEPEGDDDEVADGAAGRYWTALVGVSYRLIFISQCGDSLTQSVLAEGLGFEKAKVMAEEHHRRCVLDWITSSQSARGQDKAGLDNRACIFCGRPAHEHPWIDHPKRGRVRGDCPMDKSAAAPPSEATVGEVAARALISRATPCGERP